MDKSIYISEKLYAMIDTIIKLVREGFSKVKAPRQENITYSMSNLLNMGFAMFSLKDSSVSSFRDSYSVRAANLSTVYGVDELVGDSAFRQGVDQVNPQELQAQFPILIDFLRQQGVLKERKVLGEYIAVSVDATGHYCSSKKQCPQCLVKNHKNGKQTFYHQLLGAVTMHPEQSTVFPVACEAIVQQDGHTKNDCELNAAKRIMPQIRQSLPNEKIVAVFDALYLNGPHINFLAQEHIDMSYIIGAKGFTYLNVQIEALRKEEKLQTVTWYTKTKICRATFSNKLILNGTHKDISTNYFEYTETDKKSKEQTFFSNWTTDIEIDAENIQELVAVARSRWKIENETFNTLKNQGYNLEHNYGHGVENLSTNFAILMFLAFFTDQIAQHLDKDFQAAKTVCKSFKMLWEKVRSIFYLLPTMSMNAIYRFIIKRRQVNMPALS